MILEIFVDSRSGKAKGRRPSETRPTPGHVLGLGLREWGRLEATWDGERWTGVLPYEIVTADLPVMSEDYPVEVDHAGGTISTWARAINAALVTGE
jgi:hypothetical protein